MVGISGHAGTASWNAAYSATSDELYTHNKGSAAYITYAGSGLPVNGLEKENTPFASLTPSIVDTMAEVQIGP